MSRGDGSTRVARVARTVRDELVSLLSAEVKDPDARGVVVTGVEMTSDLQLGRVRVRLLEDGDEQQRRRLLKALERARPFLRREVTGRLGLRRAPDLRFEYDLGVDQASRVEALLAEISSERRK